jgi:hypothetical protein
MHTATVEHSRRNESDGNGNVGAATKSNRRSERRHIMLFMSAAMNYLFFTWIGVTIVLLALVIYGNTLSMKEEDQLYLNAAEEKMLATDQRALIVRMNRLMRVIMGVAVCCAVLLVATAGTWVWIGFHS